MKLIVDIKKNFPGFNLDVAFETRSGILGLLGESGSGKSMILRCIAGLVKPDCGKIILNGETLFDSEKNINLPIKNRKIGFLFQNYALFPHMTVEKNISYALANFSKSERNKIVNDTLKIMQLKDYKKRYPHQLSGGQQQRVALARALAIDPKALFLDEPFSALDNHLRNLMIKQMMETLNSYKGPTLFVTHNLEEAYQLCDDIIILSQGKIQAKGSKKHIFNNPPSLCAARITGCKNISPVKLTENDSLQASNWNCTIKPIRIFDKKITHIGIRAHYLQLTEVDGLNTFDCWPAYTSETPFRVFVYLKVNNIPVSISDYNLVWDISSEEYEAIKNLPHPWKIHFNEDKLIFINEK